MVTLARPVAEVATVGDTLDQIGEYTYRAWVMTVPVARIAERAAAYAMPGVTVYGNDLSAIARARAGDGPSLVENLTYRWRGHSKSDRNRYHSKEEIEAWIARDPIARFPAELIAHGSLDEAVALAIEAAAAEAVAQGIDFAKASPAPTAADVTRYVYAEARE